MRSQSWKPIVYASATIGAAVAALAAAYLLVLAIDPQFTFRDVGRGGGRIVLGIVALITYGAAMGATRLLRRFYGREFGTYLDEPDAPEGLGSEEKKRCRRCGSLFAAFHNDHHAAGFCSHGCREAQLRSGAKG